MEWDISGIIHILRTRSNVFNSTSTFQFPLAHVSKDQISMICLFISFQIGLLVQAILPEKRLNLIILFHRTCNTRQVHAHSFNCFSCQLSLWKGQETKFSHTEWDTWVQARMLHCSFTHCHVSQFFFSCRTVQQFFPPSHPFASYCLQFSRRQCSNVWVVFRLLLTPILWSMWCW